MKFLLLLLSAIQVQATVVDTVRYTVLTTGVPSGKQLKWTGVTGQINYFFEFNDRGRGPQLNVSIRVQDGMVVSRTANGVDYYKGDVKETFEINGTSAAWRNKIEDDRKEIAGKVVYSPLNRIPGEIELALQTALQTQQHEVEIVPGGKLVAKHLKNHKATVHGMPIELELWSFTGSGGPPAYAWFTPKKEFFASIGGWMSTILEGSETLVAELKALQDETEAAYFYNQAGNLAQNFTAPVAFINVDVFDAEQGRVLSGQTVVIEKDRIRQIGPSKKVKLAPSTHIIEARGKMLLPGLWDNHVHYSMPQGLYHLAAGVTNVKDLGNSLDLPEVKLKIENNELLGPEISILSGFIDFAGPYAGPTGKIVKSLEEGIEAVNFYADRGYQQIKLYSSIKPDWVKPLAERAHQRGMKICGHVPSFMTAERAINDGYNQIIHLNMMMLNFLGDTLDTRSMLRFIRVAERARMVDLNSPEVKRFFRLLKEKQIIIDPTAAIFERMFTNQPGKLAKGYDGTIEMFPADLRRGFYYGGLPTMIGHEVEYAQSFDNMVRMLKLLHENGIQFVPGTDDFPGFTLHRELEIYVMAGVPAVEVLQKATIQSARVAGLEKDYGSIAVGKKANLVLIDGNPVKNISDIRKAELTMKNGNLFDAKKLYASYGFGFWK